MRKRFGIEEFCIVSDRGTISAATMKQLEDPERDISYILGARMRKVNEVGHEVLSRAGRFRDVVPEGGGSKAPAPLKVKEAMVGDSRYVVCLNTKQARKDKADREAIVETLAERIKSGPKAMIGNKGYRKYLKVTRNSVAVDEVKIEAEARFDSKWVHLTNTDLPAEEVAQQYKELWRVEHVFRDMKSILETRPIHYQRDETISGHAFCSFLALPQRKELDRRLDESGCDFEWNDIKRDLKSLHEVVINENGIRMAVRSECVGTCGKVFKAFGVAVPPSIREL